jgi:hypothetical protein
MAWYAVHRAVRGLDDDGDFRAASGVRGNQQF